MVSSAPKRRERIESHKLGDEWMLYDPETGSLHVVNETAGFVWRLCDGSSGFEQICRRVREEFAVPEGTDVRADVVQAVEALAELGVLETD
jgi:PqqD family protein of HPr-rel-A system